MSILNIVDKKGNIIGEDTRDNIHKKGLLHKEVHVLFFTLRGEIIFQLRAKDKDTFPNLLDATVGGHVELGDDYLSTALKEMFEETGIKADKKDLRLITTIYSRAEDSITEKINNVIRAIYAYGYKGEVGELKVEKNKAQGFEAWSIDGLIKGLPDYERKRFIYSMLDKQSIEIYKKIRKLLLK